MIWVIAWHKKRSSMSFITRIMHLAKSCHHMSAKWWEWPGHMMSHESDTFEATGTLKQWVHTVVPTTLELAITNEVVHIQAHYGPRSLFLCTPNNVPNIAPIVPLSPLNMEKTPVVCPTSPRMEDACLHTSNHGEEGEFGFWHCIKHMDKSQSECLVKEASHLGIGSDCSIQMNWENKIHPQS